jgi:hypothetical protein
VIAPRHVLLSLAALVLQPAAAQAAERCFAYETETAGARLALELPDGDGPVSGTEQGGVQDQEQGYFTSWESRITGYRTGDRLDVTVEIAIEDDRQVEEQAWRIEDGAIVTDRDRFEPVACGDDGESAFDAVPEHGADDVTTGHCLDGEDVILTCELGGDEAVSVCAAADRSTLFARQGPVVAPDLELPGEAQGSVGRFVIHSIGYSGGYDTRLGLVSGDYTYVVYERMISRGAGDPGKDMEGGVLLYEGGELRSDTACDGLGAAGIGLNQLFGVVEERAFFDEEGLLD